MIAVLLEMVTSFSYFCRLSRVFCFSFMVLEHFLQRQNLCFQCNLCAAYNKDIPIALTDMHDCGVDAKINMNFGMFSGCF